MKTHDVPDTNVGKINGKTPEEVKKGMAMCTHGADCGCCPYTLYECSKNQMEQDALAYIQQLESRLAQAEREMDALMNDLQTAINRGRSFNFDCEFCKGKDKPVCKVCEWQWRGVCPENTKEDTACDS